jgi:hypothetical protein
MRRIPDLPPPDFVPRERWYKLLPRRSVGKVIALLIMLAGVIYFRSRAGSVARLVGPGVAPVRFTSRPESFRPIPTRAPGDGAAADSVPSSAP